MSKPDIEVLDDGDAYPYSSHIRVDETEVQLGDLLLVFESGESHSVNFFEQICGFTWPGVITHVVDGPVPAEFHEFDSLSEGIDSGKLTIAPQREQTSFFVDDDTVRTITLYRYQYQGGWQPILIDERRDPLEDTSFNESITLCEDGEQVIEELLGTSSPEEKQEIEHIREFLRSAGYQLDSISDSDE
ncbi:hypothetical protein [Halolamina salina]|uniref:Uncharacterized protein n=1 Tax=Halolamina salina TaxID=1220023 RepID=A0ABD6BAK0_9EURY